MLQRPCLLVFVDGLPTDYLDRFPSLGRFPVRQSVTPGLGYSVNIKAEMYTGMSPDGVGYFNEWSYSRDSGNRCIWLLFRLSSLASRVYLFDRIVHRFWSRILQRNILNIPFRYLPFFKAVGLDLYSGTYPLPTMFKQASHLKVIDHGDYLAGPGRDQQLVAAALSEIAKGTSHLFVSSVDLDHIGHVHGLGSPQYEERIDFLNASLGEMAQQFRAKYPNGIIALFSDHGMVNVTRGVEMNLEAEFGRCSHQRYIYFMDSTMLRVWSFDPVLTREIREFLLQRGDGVTLNDEQRVYYGVTNHDFATHIYILNEGMVFMPSFFGRKMPKGMHGYMPDLPSQHGVLAVDGDPAIADDVQRSRDLWGMFSRI